VLALRHVPANQNCIASDVLRVLALRHIPADQNCMDSDVLHVFTPSISTSIMTESYVKIVNEFKTCAASMPRVANATSLTNQMIEWSQEMKVIRVRYELIWQYKQS